MTELDRINNPLRLSVGSHEEGSGKGCVMNVVSYVNGDMKITDFDATLFLHQTAVLFVTLKVSTKGLEF